MKKKGKFSKFLLGSAAVAGVATGVYYVYKNFIANDDYDDFEDFDDEFDDDFFDDITVDDFEDSKEDESTREYVSININGTSESEDEEVETDNLMDVQEVTADDTDEGSAEDKITE